MQKNLGLIDISSPIPAYHQITSDIVKRINEGEWKIGDRLPSEQAFSAEYNVSRVTIRQSLAELQTRGIIIRYQGKGAFLTGSPKPFVEDLKLPSVGIIRDSKSRNTSTILKFHLVQEVPIYVREAFSNEATNFPLIFLSRIFSKKGYPLGLNQAWFPSRLVPEMVGKGLINTSITETLKFRYDIDITRVENIIEATRANAEEASLLSIPYDSTLLRIQSSHFANDNILVQFSDTLWVGELTRFRVIVD